MEKRKTTRGATKKRGKGSGPLKYQILGAAIMIIIGGGLLIAGFTVPPQGEIHSSVLVAFGEILTFVGALFGIDYHYRSR